MKQAERFCDCIKQVSKTVKMRKGTTRGQRGPRVKEQAAIAICVKSVLQKRGRTLKKFRCRKGPKLETQQIK